MKVEYVMPFVQASMNVMQQVMSVSPERGQLCARPEVFTSQQLNIVCGITGDIQGQVIYGMSMTTADKVASSMIGQTIVQFDQLAASAIAELAAVVSLRDSGANQGALVSIVNSISPANPSDRLGCAVAPADSVIGLLHVFH